MQWRNSLRLVAVVFMVAALFGVVGTVHAEDNPQTIERAPQFCQRIDSLTNRMLEKTNEYYRSASPVRLDNDEQLVKRRAAFDKKLANLRSKAEEDRQRHVEAMLARAKSETQSRAIEQYSIVLKQAIDARQSAVDGVVRDYRNHVDSELRSVQESRKANRQQFVDQVNITLKQAKADCTDGNNDPVISRQDFAKALDLAQETAIEDRKLLDATAKSIRQSHEESKQQIISAFAQFNKSMEQAREQLVSSVGSLLQ